MKIQHKSQGNPCARCGARPSQHRGPRPEHDNRKRPGRIYPKRLLANKLFIGIDGEGQTDRATGKHKYVMLCAAAENDGQTWTVRNPNGLSSVECLEFIMNLPEDSKIFAYSFGYDLTKILEDVDDLRLYKLVRTKLRERMVGNYKRRVPVYFRDRYSIDYLNGETKFFRIQKTDDPFTDKPFKNVGKSRTIHDIWRFYQGKFTEALKNWRVPRGASDDERKRIIKRMVEMKDQRANFDRMTESEVHAYCLDECRYMAELARLLVSAHETAQIPLKAFYGAGSSASAMLEKLGIKEHVKRSREENPTPSEVQYAIQCAFFGGRFENSRIGIVRGPVFSFDISSAYPYHICFLPCLIHGKWEKTKDRWRAEKAAAAIVHYRVDKPRVKQAWAPFPYRTKEGAITFPEVSAGGWVWRDEYFMGERVFPNVRFREAWVYECECDCQLFTGGELSIPGFYIERLKIGKEGPGIVIKLGVNSCYGKMAQFIGSELGKFTSFFWAGLITSGCRAQALEVMGLHKDLDNLLMIATDGIATLEDIVCPIPRDTGTFDAKDTDGNVKPLGAWERKVLKKGLFLARPGIYFPVDPSEEDIEKVRGRGVGRKVIYEHYNAIVKEYEAARIGKGSRPSIEHKKGAEVWTNDGDLITTRVRIKELSRFIGIKTAISRGGIEPDYKYKRSVHFGRWITRPLEMSFDPHPKREGIDSSGRLGLRRMTDDESMPYKREIMSEETKLLKALAEEAAEQPDGGDLVEDDWNA